MIKVTAQERKKEFLLPSSSVYGFLLFRMIKIPTPARMLKSPKPTMTPTIIPVLFFPFDGGLLSTVGLKSEQQYVTIT